MIDFCFQVPNPLIYNQTKLWHLKWYVTFFKKEAKPQTWALTCANSMEISTPDALAPKTTMDLLAKGSG